MANINVKDFFVENGANQILGDPFEVTVHVNNREIVTPDDWKETHCEYEGMGGTTYAGHGAEVEVQLIKDGEEVESKSTSVCAPTVPATEPDPRPSWTFSPESPGEYDLRATVTPKGHGPTSTQTHTIQVSETGQQTPPENDDGGNDNTSNTGSLPARGDADGDGVMNFIDPAPKNPDVPGSDPTDPLNIGGQMDKLLLVAGILGVAWLASSGAEVIS